MKVRRSKTLPWPPVILAIMSLPQTTNQITPLISRITMNRMMLVMTLRFFDTGFFTFFDLMLSETSDAVFGVVSEAFSSPLFSSKSNIWVGLRKSSAAEVLRISRGVS